ncbi:aldolase/citrate lyase family protein [Agromyces atrinae]|uniref:HpcH/HpaI aldolase family protein n=1 Tax=Agromyces atrinae TaxID=592376 RepID=UPI001F58D67C|nr:aldolase/citrate lyase family protein [Agromyces atrinae]MCI2956528.1 aldolase/citrate lyase family protein [Agromyces atrinae]
MSSDAPRTVQIGGWSMLGSPAAASLMAHIGADWLLLDGQHGLYDDASIIASLATAPTETAVHVRVPTNSAALIGRALDAGAAGVVVPMVQDAAQAAAAAAATRYAPEGSRSWGPLAAYRGAPVTPAAEANRLVSCAVMVETDVAVGNVDAIAATPGVDMVLVGPFDLSIALGLTLGELLADHSPGNPLDTVVAACRAAGTTAGAFAGSLDVARELIGRGFTSVAVAVDSQLITAAGTALVAEARALASEDPA